jgi:hypothetical protein
MAVNPWEGVQQAGWAGREMLKAGAQAGKLGEQVGKTGWQTRATPQSAPVGSRKEPGAAQGQQFQASNALGRADYGSQQTNQPQQQQNANTRGRRGAFGKGGGGAGITIQNQFGDNAFGIGNVSGQNNAGGIGNIIGDNNTNSGNMGIGNYQAGGPAPTAGATAPAPAPAGPAPKGTKPGRTPIPVGGGKTPKGLPAGAGPTPALPAGPAAPTPVGSGPKAIGPGTGATPTPTRPQGTRDVRTREQKIADVAAQGATPGERAAATAAQGRISGTPATPAISAPATQQISSAPAQAEKPSAPQQAQVPKFGNPEAYNTKLGPRRNEDGTEDKTQYTVGGQRLMPTGENPGSVAVQPAAVQPSSKPKGKNTIGGNIYPSTPEGDAMRAKDQAKNNAKKPVAKAAAKTPKIRNTSQKPKVAMKADKREKKQPKKGK